MELRFHADPLAFLAVAGERLALDPVLSTVVASVTTREAERGPQGERPRWWVSVHDGPEVVGVGMRTARTAPYALYVLPMPDEAARLLARTLVERGETVPGVNGALPTAQVVAEEAARLTGRRARVHHHTRLHVLDTLVEPAAPPGHARLAVRTDEDLVADWLGGFLAAAAAQAGRTPQPGEVGPADRDDVRARIDDGLVWLWEYGGRPVCLVGHNAPSLGVARVGPVFTPLDARGHGYAAALTAHVSRVLRDGGARVCLFTDQANAVSNRLYAALGYVPVVDMADLVVEANP